MADINKIQQTEDLVDKKKADAEQVYNQANDVSGDSWADELMSDDVRKQAKAPKKVQSAPKGTGDTWADAMMSDDVRNVKQPVNVEQPVEQNTQPAPVQQVENVDNNLYKGEDLGQITVTYDKSTNKQSTSVERPAAQPQSLVDYTKAPEWRGEPDSWRYTRTIKTYDEGHPLAQAARHAKQYGSLLSADELSAVYANKDWDDLNRQSQELMRNNPSKQNTPQFEHDAQLLSAIHNQMVALEYNFADRNDMYRNIGQKNYRMFLEPMRKGNKYTEFYENLYNSGANLRNSNPLLLDLPDKVEAQKAADEKAGKKKPDNYYFNMALKDKDFKERYHAWSFFGSIQDNMGWNEYKNLGAKVSDLRKERYKEESAKRFAESSLYAPVSALLDNSIAQAVMAVGNAYDVIKGQPLRSESVNDLLQRSMKYAGEGKNVTRGVLSFIPEAVSIMPVTGVAATRAVGALSKVFTFTPRAMKITTGGLSFMGFEMAKSALGSWSQGREIDWAEMAGNSAKGFLLGAGGSLISEGVAGIKPNINSTVANYAIQGAGKVAETGLFASTEMAMAYLGNDKETTWTSSLLNNGALIISMAIGHGIGNGFGFKSRIGNATIEKVRKAGYNTLANEMAKHTQAVERGAMPKGYSQAAIEEMQSMQQSMGNNGLSWSDYAEVLKPTNSMMTKPGTNSIEKVEDGKGYRIVSYDVNGVEIERSKVYDEVAVDKEFAKRQREVEKKREEANVKSFDLMRDSTIKAKAARSVADRINFDDGKSVYNEDGTVNEAFDGVTADDILNAYEVLSEKPAEQLSGEESQLIALFDEAVRDYGAEMPDSDAVKKTLCERYGVEESAFDAAWGKDAKDRKGKEAEVCAAYNSIMSRPYEVALNGGETGTVDGRQVSIKSTVKTDAEGMPLDPNQRVYYDDGTGVKVTTAEHVLMEPTVEDPGELGDRIANENLRKALEAKKEALKSMFAEIPTDVLESNLDIARTAIENGEDIDGSMRLSYIALEEEIQHRRDSGVEETIAPTAEEPAPIEIDAEGNVIEGEESAPIEINERGEVVEPEQPVEAPKADNEIKPVAEPEVDAERDRKIDELLDFMGYQGKEREDARDSYLASPEALEEDYNDYLAEVQKEVSKKEEPVGEKAPVPEEEPSVDNSPQEQKVVDNLDEPMPLLDDGEPNVDLATPRRTRKFLYEESGLEAQDATDKIDYEIKRAKENAKKTEKGAPKMGDKGIDGNIGKFKKAQQEWNDKKAAADAKLEYWNEVKRQQGLYDLIDEIGETKNPKPMADLVVKLKGRFKNDREILNALNTSSVEPRTVYEACMLYLSSGARFIWDSDGARKGLKQELGYGEGERKKMIGLLSKDGTTVQKAVHDIIDQYGADLGLDLSESQVVYDTLLEALGGISTKGDVYAFINERRLHAVEDILRKRLGNGDVQSREEAEADARANEEFETLKEEYKDELPENPTEDDVLNLMEQKRQEQEIPTQEEIQSEGSIPNENGITDDFFKSGGEDEYVPFRDGEGDAGVAEPEDGNAPAFYSNAARAVEGIKQNKATAEQWLAMIKKAGGLKAGEDKWMGLSQWLEDNKGKSLTKEEVQQFIADNGIEMEETTYSEAPQSFDSLKREYDQWLHDEGFDYAQEQLRERFGDDADIAFDDLGGELVIANEEAAAALLGSDDIINQTRLDYTTEGLDNKREIAFKVPSIEPYQEHDEVHFGPENQGKAVMWVRFGETYDADGKRVLVIDEIQSNRHQEGRENGYVDTSAKTRYDEARKAYMDYGRELAAKYNVPEKFVFTSANDAEKKQLRILLKEQQEAKRLYDENYGIHSKAVPAAPFEKNWHEVAMKRMLRLAAEEGFDKVAWTTGEQQAERYNIGNVVNRIVSEPYEAQSPTESNGHDLFVALNDGTIHEMFVQPDGTLNSESEMFDGKNVREVFGKELGEKIATTTERTELEGDGLRIGGEGMKGFYDQMLPRFMDKYGKRWGTKTGEVQLATPGKEVMHSVDVTPEMKESVMQGQPLFRQQEPMGERGVKKVTVVNEPEYREGTDYFGRPMTHRVRPGQYKVEGYDDIFNSVEEVADFMRKKNPDYCVYIDEDGNIGYEAWSNILPEGMKPNTYAKILASNGGKLSSAMKKRIERYTEREMRQARVRAEEITKELGLDVEFHDDPSEFSGRKSRAKGWYDPKTGKIHVVMGNHSGVGDVVATMLHEGVAHHGLRKLFGEDFDTFLDNVHNNVSEDIRTDINDRIEKMRADDEKNDVAHSDDYYRRAATEEYLADLAEDGLYNGEQNTSYASRAWQWIKENFINMLRKAGINIELSDDELRYILWSSHKNLRRGAEAMAEDAVMREKAGIKDYVEDGEPVRTVAERDVRYGNEEAMRKQQESKNFKDWFGDWENDPENASKVVDEDGRPKVVYRGDAPGRYIMDNAQGSFFSDRDDVTKGYAGKDGQINAVYLDIKNPAFMDNEASYNRLRNEINDMMFDFYDMDDGELSSDGRWRALRKYYLDFRNNEGSSIRDFFNDFLPEASEDMSHEELVENMGQALRDLNQFSYREADYRDMDIANPFLRALGYDGVIRDYDKNGQAAGKEYITFSPTQIKSATENNGDFSRENPDIRFRDGEEEVTPANDLAERLRERMRQRMERARAAGGGEPPIEPPTPPAPATPEPAPELPPTGYDRPMSPIEMAQEAAIKAVADTKASLEQRNAARKELTSSLRELMKAVRQMKTDVKEDEISKKLYDLEDSFEAGEIPENEYKIKKAEYLAQVQPGAAVKGAMDAQSDYDRTTVENVVSLCKMMVQSGLIDRKYISNLTPLFTKLKDSTGKEDLTSTVNGIMDVMLKSQERSIRNELNTLLNTKAQRINQSGVVTQGGVDLRGQRTLQSLNENFGKSVEDIDHRIAQLEDLRGRIPENSEERLNEVDDKIQGALLAKAYMETAKNHEDNITVAEEELAEIKAQYKDGELGLKEYTEQKHALETQIRSYRMSHADAMWDYVNTMRGIVAEGRSRAKDFIEAQKAHKNEIRHNAYSDMAGTPQYTQSRPGRLAKAVNSSVSQFVSSSLYTLDTMLRQLGHKHANGEGYLYERFGRGWLEARDREIRDYWADREELDKKAQELFGVKRFANLIDAIRKMPKMEVPYKDGGDIVNHTLDQAQLMYIYMVNKMEDGIVKLRRMGISEEDVETIKNFMNPKLVELADWLQDDFLPSRREEYNEVHRRMFGADMDMVENYVPLRIDKGNLTETVDINNGQNEPSLASTVTGGIIKRTHNTTPIDIMGTNAIDMILEHLDEMNHWKNFAEWNRDVNTLLSDKTFRNKVKNTTTIYGSGDKLWKHLKDVFFIAGGTYMPKGEGIDKAMVNIAKGVSAAKVSFRMFTAIKQLLSLPVFAANCNVGYMVKNMAKPAGSWNWCMENLPSFKHRWSSRIAGDTRLEDTDIDWQYTHKKWVEKAGKWGLSPNAFVDAMTVAVGARSVYEQRYKRYRKDGYDDVAADRRARQDATAAFNQTQQSSEKMFVAPMQVDRTLLAVGASLFRNASMGYERQFVEGLRNLKHLFGKERVVDEDGNVSTVSYKTASIEFMKKQMERNGLTETQAETAAKRIYNRSIWRNALKLAMFGFGAQMAWNVGGKLPYLAAQGYNAIMGDDDERKQAGANAWDTTKEAWWHAVAGGWLEGLPFGNVVSDGINNEINGENFFKFSPDLLPFFGDTEDVANHFDGKNKLRGATDLVNLGAQMFIGVNPQTFLDIMTGIVDITAGKKQSQADFGTAKEALLLTMRIMQCPQSQLDQLYIDELGMNARQAQSLTPEQVARRYAFYKAHHDVPYLWHLYNQEKQDELIKQYEKNFNKKLNEDVKEAGGTPEDYHDLSESATTEKETLKYRSKEIDVLSEQGPEALMKAWEKERDKGSAADYKYMKSLMTRYQKDVYGKGKTPDDADEAELYQETHGEDIKEQAQKIGRDLGFGAQDSYFQLSHYKAQHTSAKDPVMKEFKGTDAGFKYSKDGKFYKMEDYNYKVPVKDPAKRAKALKVIKDHKEELRRNYRNGWRMARIKFLYGNIESESLKKERDHDKMKAHFAEIIQILEDERKDAAEWEKKHPTKK